MEAAPTTTTIGDIVLVKSTGKLAVITSRTPWEREGRPGLWTSYRTLRDGKPFGPSRYTTLDNLSTVD